MTGLSRRNLIALGGAATILSACDRHKEGNEGQSPNSSGNNNGDDPSKPGPGPLIADYYSLVILRINKDLKLEASHGSFDTPSKTDEKLVRATVLAQLERLGPAGDVQSLNPLKDSSGYDFEKWGFGSTRRVYIYVDNQSLVFEKHEPLTFKAVSSIRFTDPERANTRKISPNRSFFGAKSDDKFARGSLLYFENYYLDGNGKPIPPKTPLPIFYAMNFHLLMASATGGKPIPIVIDPDTGNGWNYPPPY
jgi:hypothetical protein